MPWSMELTSHRWCVQVTDVYVCNNVMGCVPQLLISIETKAWFYDPCMAVRCGSFWLSVFSTKTSYSALLLHNTYSQLYMIQSYSYHILILR